MKDFYQQSVVKPLMASLTLLHTGTVRKEDFGASRVLLWTQFFVVVAIGGADSFLFFVGSYGCPRGCVIMNDDLFHESLLLRFDSLVIVHDGGDDLWCALLAIVGVGYFFLCDCS